MRAAVTAATLALTACACAAAAIGLLLLLYGVGPVRQDERAGPEPAARRLPHCIIIGARKCGTRALLDFLDAHPGVAAAKGEVHYFDSAERLRQGLEWYRAQMPDSRVDQVTVEKTPAYFVTEAAPGLARRQMSPDLRLLLIVRDPVTRVVSDYAQHLHRRAKLGLPARPLERLVFTSGGRGGGGGGGSWVRVNPRAKIVRTSVYHVHLRRWLGHFPADRIHIVDGDRLIAEPHAELRAVERFLGLPEYLRADRFAFNATKGFYCVRAAEPGVGHRCLGSEKGRPHPPVAPSTLAKLRRYFAEHDDRLAALVGRRFAWMSSTPPRRNQSEAAARGR